MSKAEIRMAVSDNVLKDKRVEGLKIQGEQCVRNGEGGLSKNVTRRQRRCRVECVGDQASAEDVHGSDSIPEDRDDRNTRHESLARTREQLEESIVRACESGNPWRSSGF